MNKILLNICLTIIGVTTTCAQQILVNKADSLYEKAERFYNVSVPTPKTDKQAIYFYQQAIEVYELDNKTLHPIVAECYRKIGSIYQDEGEFGKALIKYRQALRTKRLDTRIHDSLYVIDYVLIGNIYHYLHIYDSAELYYQLADWITQKYKIKKHTPRLYNSTGNLYSDIGNYGKAVVFFEKAMHSLDENERDYERDKMNFTNNIAHSKERMGYYNEAISLYWQLIDNDVVSETLYQNLGQTYIRVNSYDSALFFLRKSLSSSHLPTRLAATNNTADVYLRLGMLDSALFFFRLSVKINREQIEGNNKQLAGAYSGLAQLHQIQNNLDSTLHYYQLALINTTFDFNDSTVTANPQDITQAISLLHLFKVLKDKATAWYQYYQQDQNPTKLQHALFTYQLAIRVAQHIRKTYDNDEAKLFLVNKVAPVYEEAIAVAVQLYEQTGESRYVIQAFQFSEASKAAVLAEGLRDVKIKTSGGVNDSLVREERRIKQQITALRLKLVESQDSAQNEAYRQQLIDQEIALARTIKYLQKDEHYYRRKYQPDTLDIAALQRSLLTDNETLLEYFVGQQDIFVFALRRDDLQVASVDRTAELDSALRRTRRQLYDYQPGQGSDEASLATLYRYLVAPIADAVTDAAKLIVVPDGALHYLPFDLLSVDGQRANYLLHSHTLQYGYSASLLQQAIYERRGYSTEAVLAMAPFTGGEAGNARSRGFSPLRDSQAEVESVGGSIYTEGEATKRRFLRVAGSYNVLHLATHATVDAEDPSQSFIAFYPQQHDSLADYRLYTHELYNMRLDSVKLVILSACEAGNGQLVRGEGVMSLARAFAYAGCPNIMTTLWKADDRSSARLTMRLHHYLKQGWEKDEALQQAKLDYLNDPKVHPARKAPYYWANFVFIGDPAPIYDNRQPWWWIAAGLLLLAIGGGALWWRLQRRAYLRQTA